jgi:Flp pilus assembly protein TadG
MIPRMIRETIREAIRSGRQAGVRLAGGRGAARRLWADTRGVTAMVLALAAVPVVVSAGMGIDVARAYAERVRLGHALDAAALAVGSTQGTPAELQARLNKYFYGNYPTTAAGKPIAISMTTDPTGNIITLTAEAQLSTTLMAVIGKSTMTVAASTQVTKQSTGLELAMVLDNTGSMITNNNIQAVRDASNLLTDILFGQNSSSSLLKISVVPYVTAVNVGSIAPNIVGSTSLIYSATDATKWKGCVTERAYPNDVEDTPITTAKWTPYYWKADAKDNAWTNGTIAYDHSSLSTCNAGSHGPNNACPTPILPLTSDKQTIQNSLNGMVAWCRSGTMSNVGLAWGWRTLSPTSPFPVAGAPYDSTKWKKAAILMTDGVNNMFKPGQSGVFANDTYKSDITAYGRLDAGTLGTTSATTATNTLNSRMGEVCSNMKTAGITIYTITFTGSADQNTKSYFLNCATDANKYFDAPDQASLKTAFQAIANDLNNLRLSK